MKIYWRLAGKEYKSKYNECKSGFIMMNTSHVNTGIILVPDSCNLTDDMKEQQLLVANYNAQTDEEKTRNRKRYLQVMILYLLQNLTNKGIDVDGVTKISLMEASIGIATIVTFIAIYLGIIFLIASAAILALKQLTESSDNKQRYTILREIGCDEKMINKALFRQIGNILWTTTNTCNYSFNIWNTICDDNDGRISKFRRFITIN